MYAMELLAFPRWGCSSSLAPLRAMPQCRGAGSGAQPAARAVVQPAAAAAGNDIRQDSALQAHIPWRPPPLLSIPPKLAGIAAALLLACSARAASASLPTVVLPAEAAGHSTGATASQSRVDESGASSVEEAAAGPVAEEDDSSDGKGGVTSRKPYALTVPLNIVALRGSIPPVWLKEFAKAQSKRAKISVDFKGELEPIATDLATAARTGKLKKKSAMAADLVTLGDSWLACAISAGLVVPMEDAETSRWLKQLHPVWQKVLRRDSEGHHDPQGLIWGAPYRWGCTVVAYRKDLLTSKGMLPIQDWKDLFRPELAGRVSMVNAPREVVGVALKSLDQAYNVHDLEEVPGGMQAVVDRLTALRRQVRVFDNVHYLKALSAGDVYAAVGWSTDVIPFAKRAGNVTVVVPASGASLFADLWAVPATNKFTSDKVGGRIRGPSPLISQWIEFCLQPARALNFKEEVYVGASPLLLTWPQAGSTQTSPADASAGMVYQERPRIDSNLVQGMPPPDILERSEFLQPLSDKLVEQYKIVLEKVGLAKPLPSRGIDERLMSTFSRTRFSWLCFGRLSDPGTVHASI
eukprot:SM000136S00185  [mRNA]  locus=s136:236230:239644:- [translate_table: standard]